MGTFFLVASILVAIYLFYEYSWKSWRPWMMVIIVIYNFGRYDSNTSNAQTPSEESPSMASEADVVETRDGLYLLNGNNRQATITVIGDQWFFESTADYTTPETGTINSDGILSNSDFSPRGEIRSNGINYLGYKFYKE